MRVQSPFRCVPVSFDAPRKYRPLRVSKGETPLRAREARVRAWVSRFGRVLRGSYRGPLGTPDAARKKTRSRRTRAFAVLSRIESSALAPPGGEPIAKAEHRTQTHSRIVAHAIPHVKPFSSALGSHGSQGSQAPRLPRAAKGSARACSPCLGACQLSRLRYEPAHDCSARRAPARDRG